jgi:hypothetical protein
VLQKRGRELRTDVLGKQFSSVSRRSTTKSASLCRGPLRSVLVSVVFRRFLGVMNGMKCVPTCDLRMMRGTLVIAVLVMLRRFVVVSGCMFVMLCRLTVMLCALMSRHVFSFTCFKSVMRTECRESPRNDLAALTLICILGINRDIQMKLGPQSRHSHSRCKASNSEIARVIRL